jgi:hypothetical protein
VLRVLTTLQCPSSSACQNATFDLSNAAGINDRGWIVGDANVPGSTNTGNATEHATVWRNDALGDLGTYKLGNGAAPDRPALRAAQGGNHARHP